MEKQKNFTFQRPLLRTFHQQIPVLPATKYKMSCLLSRMLLFLSSKIPAKSCQLEMKILKFNKLKMLKKSKSKYLIAIHVPICLFLFYRIIWNICFARCQVILYFYYIFKILLHFLDLPKISYITPQIPAFFQNYEKKSWIFNSEWKFHINMTYRKVAWHLGFVGCFQNMFLFL